MTVRSLEFALSAFPGLQDSLYQIKLESTRASGRSVEHEASMVTLRRWYCRGYLLDFGLGFSTGSKNATMGLRPESARGPRGTSGSRTSRHFPEARARQHGWPHAPPDPRLIQS